ncbi:MAG: hypothetical protein ACO2Z9_01875 [Crocinitomicaceae bacterium]
MFVSGQNVDNLEHWEHSGKFDIFVMMQKLIFIFALALPLMSYGQKEVPLKRKYMKSYSGIVPSYNMDVGDNIVEVTATPISIQIEKDSVFFKIGQNKFQGTYTVMFEANKYYLLNAVIDGQLANERIMVHKRGRTISRDGLYPQPMAELKRD